MWRLVNSHRAQKSTHSKTVNTRTLVTDTVKTQVLVGHSMAQGIFVLKREWKALLEGHSDLKLPELLPGTPPCFLPATEVPEHEHTLYISAAVPRSRRDGFSVHGFMVRLIQCFWLEVLDKHERDPGKILWQRGSSSDESESTVIKKIVVPPCSTHSSQAEQRDLSLQWKLGSVKEQ